MQMLLAVCLCWVGVNETADERVENAARQFRISTYSDYRTQRAEFDRRLEAADALLEAWRGANRPAHRAEEVKAWFDAAGSVDANSDLPSAPLFAASNGSSPTDIEADPATPFTWSKNSANESDSATTTQLPATDQSQGIVSENGDSISSQPAPGGVLNSLSRAFVRGVIGSQ